MNGQSRDGNSPEVSGGSVGYGINPKGIIYIVEASTKKFNKRRSLI